MTRSNTPTDYILLPAYTDSEIETCKFVIVYVSPSYKAELTTRLALLQPLKADPYLSGLSFWDGSAAYYTGYGEGNESILGENDAWVYVNLTAQELEELPVPEHRLDTFELKLTPGGFAYFSAFAKYTSEEFWSGQFSIAELCGL